MREYKFRAWDNGNDIMYYSDEETDDIIWTLCDDGIFVEELTQFDSCPNGEHEQIIGYSRIEQQNIMQYTGLKDKNGQEIYEGDIVKIHRFTQELGENLGVREGEKEFIASIKLKPYGGVTLCIGDVEEGYLWEYENGFHEESVEIIGNIHENPELLEAK